MNSIKGTKILIIGSGGNGISCAVKLKQAGETDFLLISKHNDFGGVWHQNRYPGCTTDIPATLYQFDYAFKADWKASHATAPELAAYMREVAEQHGLYEHVSFNTELLSAEWLPDEVCWKVVTNKQVYYAKFLVPATGFLEEPVYPKLQGIDSFEGPAFHSAYWPENFNWEGLKIAVIGTGSSALQIVPSIQKTAGEVLVFQRTPTYVLPLGREEYSEEQVQLYRDNPEAFRAKAAADLGFFIKGWNDVSLGGNQDTADEFYGIFEKHYETLTDPSLRDALRPDHKVGCKRPGLSDTYYTALSQNNVKLVPEAAVKVGPKSIVTSSGAEYKVDVIVYATGFLFGGNILNRIRRRDSVSVADYQNGHPRAYKSVSVAGCPNMFLVGGAGPNGQVWNGLHPGQAIPTYILKTMEYMYTQGINALEVKEDAELRWKREADEILAKGPTVSGGCMNYSLDAQGFNKAAYPGSIADMDEAMKNFDPSCYTIVA